MKKETVIKLLISAGAFTLLIARLLLPHLQVDAVTIGLLVVCILPWASTFVESLKAPGGWEVKLRDLESKVDKVIDASSESATESPAMTPTGSELNDSESSVLRALTKATVPLRSISGICTDVGLEAAEVQRHLEALEEKGLATEVAGKLGIRWGITPAGRRRLEVS